MPQRGWIRRRLSKQNENQSKSHRKQSGRAPVEPSEIYPYPSLSTPTHHEFPGQTHTEDQRHQFYCPSAQWVIREILDERFGNHQCSSDAIEGTFLGSRPPELTDTTRANESASLRIWHTSPHWEALHSRHPEQTWTLVEDGHPPIFGSVAAGSYRQVQTAIEHREVSFTPQMLCPTDKTCPSVYCSCGGDAPLEIETTARHLKKQPMNSRDFSSSLFDIDILGQTLSGLDLSQFPSAPAFWMSPDIFRETSESREYGDLLNNLSQFQYIRDIHPILMGAGTSLNWGRKDIHRTQIEYEIGNMLEFEHMGKMEARYSASEQSLPRYGPFLPTSQEENLGNSMWSTLPTVPTFQHNKDIFYSKAKGHLVNYNKRWSEINARTPSSDAKEELSIPWPSSALEFTMSSLYTSNSPVSMETETMCKLNIYRFFCFSFCCHVIWKGCASSSGGVFDVWFDGHPGRRMLMWKELRNQLKLEKVRWHEDKMKVVFRGNAGAGSENYECVQMVWSVVIDLKEKVDSELSMERGAGT